MRHQKTRHKLSRDSAHRKALLANLCIEVIDHERIKTTEAKAKAVKPEIEKLITLARKGDLHARRQAISIAPAPRQGRDLQALRGDRAALHGAPGWLHPHPQARPAPDRTRPKWSTSSWSERPKLTLEYDGGPFAGWAVQPGLRTVAAEVVNASRSSCVNAGRPRRRGADRPRRPRARSGRLLRRPAAQPALVNAVLPHEIVVRTREAAPRLLRATRRRARTYRLSRARPPPPSPFERGRALWWPHRSTSTRSRPARRRCTAPTTSPRSLPARPTTRASRATSSAPSGCATATSSSSRSKPTRSCAT